MEGDSATAADEAPGTLDHPNKGEDGKDQRSPVDKARRSLVGIDGPERPSNCNRSRKITFGGRECVGRSCSLEEEARMDNEKPFA